MKNKLNILIILIFTLLIVGYTNSEYEAELLNVEDYENTKLGEWIDTCDEEDGYYEYIISDPDSWELFIFINNFNKDLHYETYTLNTKKVGSTLRVTIDKEFAVTESQVMEDILLYVSAPLIGARPTTIEVIVDGAKMKKINGVHID